MTTPNMGLAYPSPSITVGPLWASLLNACFDVVDFHDHTTGKGVKIPSAGLNIDADLSMGSKNLTTIRSLRLDNQTATLSTASDLRILYSKNGELAYRDASGNEVILTNAGSVSGATGTISGLSSPASASFNNITGSFSFLKDTSKPGKVVSSDLLLYEYNNASANALTVKSPASLAAAYTMTLPAAVPTQSLPVVMDTAGTLSLGWGDGSVGTPVAAFASELSTGFYRPSNGQVAIAGTGTQLALFTSSAATLPGRVQGAVADATLPTYAWTTDTNTGMYLAGSDQIGFATGGAARATISSVGLVTNVPYSGTAATLSGALTSNSVSTGVVDATSMNSSGAIAAGSISSGVGGDGAIKWKVFSGTLASGASVVLTITGTILGFHGITSTASSARIGIPYSASASTDACVFNYTTGGSATTTNIYNTSASSTRSYWAIVYYQ